LRQHHRLGTFATWNVQCNQACFLDSTLMPGSYVASRVLVWLAGRLSTIVALSLKPLHLGHFLASFSLNSQPTTTAPPPTPPRPPPPVAARGISEPILAAAYILATVAAVVVPQALKGAPQLVAAAGLGACGTFLRYFRGRIAPSLSVTSRLKTKSYGAVSRHGHSRTRISESADAL
jgi:hypothetical protein